MSEGVAALDELSDDEPANRTTASPVGPQIVGTGPSEAKQAEARHLEAARAGVEPVTRIPGRRRAEPHSPAGSVGPAGSAGSVGPAGSVSSAGSIGAVGPGWTYRPPAVSATFTRTPWGHRGYDEAGVDAFADQVAKDLAAAETEIGDLRAEVDRLHKYIRRQWAAVAAAEAAGDRSAGRIARPGDLVSPAAQARAVLSQAQEIAERRLAEADGRLAEADRVAAERLRAADEQALARLVETDDAVTRQLADGDQLAAERLSRADTIAEQVLAEAREQADRRRAGATADARRLLLAARSRYEDIVVRAHQRADRAAEMAVDELENPDAATNSDESRARAELEVKAAYLRTFAKVSRAALQAALDVTAREFERLLGASASVETDAEAEAAAVPS